MRNRRVIFIGAVLAMGLGAHVARAETARAVIKGTAQGSPIKGAAELTETPEGLKVMVQITGAPAGKHGLHIHQYGDCGEQGSAAGGHFNPKDAPHGFLPADGSAKAHLGDMGNIEIKQDGSASLIVVLPEVTVSGSPRSVAGRSIILHEKEDDFGQPTGNAGGRIGCGTIILTAK